MQFSCAILTALHEPTETKVRILLINPNVDAAITDFLLKAARRFASPGTQLAGATGRFGARYIATRTAYAIAGHAALDAFAEHGDTADTVVLACFGDPGIRALQEIAPMPVIGMAEAACHAASSGGRRFAIVTGGERWVPILSEFVSGLGLRDQLTSVRAVASSGGEIAADPEGNLPALAEACREAVKDGAEAVILGGAGLVGIPERLTPDVSVPLIDSLAPALAAAEAAARNRSGERAPGAAPISIPTVGLGARLSRLMSGRKIGEVA